MQVVRENEAYVAGHSQQIFRTAYDRQGREITQTCCNALQEKRDTIGPLLALDLPSQTSVGEDRRERIENLKKDAERKNSLKAEQKKLLLDPVTPSNKIQFFRKALNINIQ